ncbi:MAG: hypothetical protein LQ340_006840 [Diploschistes diacapsis]|nr:MAG: hypothetical protein LQ340_006840 [Diploschistes diacapsis]
MSQPQNGLAIDRQSPEEPRVSAVRQYLEDKNQFAWKDGSIECKFVATKPAPLLWKRSLDASPRKSNTALIDEYSVDGAYKRFDYTFAVKQIIDASELESRSRAQTEVRNMLDLRHPHVCVLLGTFWHCDRLHILIYPAAACDLGDLFNDISKHYPTDQHLTPKLTKSQKPRELPQDSYLGQRSVKDKLTTLRGYFVCLCQALSYLHEVGMRHKDIKPENCLIDWQGYIILTDFGISKRFEKNVPHVTTEGTMRTERYMSPEMADLDPNAFRDDPDDVFMLGCVFLEMASIILGFSWPTIKNHFSYSVNVTGKNENFCANLGKLDAWCTKLATLQSPRFLSEKEIEPVSQSVETICKMMSKLPENRPKSKDLWKDFAFKDQAWCRDCHPDHKEAWKPSPVQIENSEAGKLRRQSRIDRIDDTPNDTSEGQDGRTRGPSGYRPIRNGGTVSPPDSPRATIIRPPQSQRRIDLERRSSLSRDTITFRSKSPKNGRVPVGRPQSTDFVAYSSVVNPFETSRPNPGQHTNGQVPGHTSRSAPSRQATGTPYITFSDESSSSSQGLSSFESYQSDSLDYFHTPPSQPSNAFNMSLPKAYAPSVPNVTDSRQSANAKTVTSRDGSTIDNREIKRSSSLRKPHEVVASAIPASTSRRLDPRLPPNSHADKKTIEGTQDPQDAKGKESEAPPSLGLQYLTDDIKNLGFGDYDKIVRYHVQEGKVDEQFYWALKGL